jgi:hypothetical protein
MNLISGSHNFCERREYAFNVLLEYSIITPGRGKPVFTGEELLREERETSKSYMSGKVEISKTLTHHHP